VALIMTLAVAAISRQLLRGSLFSLVTVYSSIFALENVGGTFLALLPNSASPGVLLEENVVINTLIVALGGYILFLAGYFARPRPSAESERKRRDLAHAKFFANTWNQRYSSALFALMAVTIAAGFVQEVQRISAAGGFQEFVNNAFKFRFGTFAETDDQNVLLGLANLFSGSALGLAGLGILAWLKGKLTFAQKAALSFLLVLLLFRQWASMFRAVLFFTFVAFFAVYYSERRVSPGKLAVFAIVGLLTLFAINYIHQYLYFLTADWSQQTLTEATSRLVAPHGHFQSLSLILGVREASGATLGGEGLLESVFFFVPRAIWHTKALSTAFGTGLVQDWAGLPTAYQMAITNVGELIAHFGYIGMLGMVLYGLLYRFLDSLATRSPDLQIAVHCVLLPRVLADLGMGVSAVSNTLVGFLLFVGILMFLRLISKKHTVRLPLRRARHESLAVLPERAAV
jgi:oligosaccharide repeat unit polymerase